MPFIILIKTSQGSVWIAIKPHVEMHGVDRERARYWISSAIDVVD
jgi:hypothetical protein